MCGFSGFIGYSQLDIDEVKLVSSSMNDKLHHRGPNDSGIWCNADEQVALAHKRLSIQDLSSAGHQPMVSPSGRFIIAYNGEIYNHLILRKNLKSEKFKGDSDTETLLVAIENWGIEKALNMANGMFAFALYDASKNISENLIEDFLFTIIDNLKNEKKIKLSKFGTFSVRSKKSRIGRNPKTKEKKIISNRDVVLFKASKEFKDLVNSKNDS